MSRSVEPLREITKKKKNDDKGFGGTLLRKVVLAPLLVRKREPLEVALAPLLGAGTRTLPAGNVSTATGAEEPPDTRFRGIRGAWDLGPSRFAGRQPRRMMRGWLPRPLPRPRRRRSSGRPELPLTNGSSRGSKSKSGIDDNSLRSVTATGRRGFATICGKGRRGREATGFGRSERRALDRAAEERRFRARALRAAKEKEKMVKNGDV